MTKELVDLIEKIKFETGLNQQEIAEKLGYEPTYLSQLMNNKKTVSSKTLEKVKCTAFNFCSKRQKL